LPAHNAQIEPGHRQLYFTLALRMVALVDKADEGMPAVRLSDACRGREWPLVATKEQHCKSQEKRQRQDECDRNNYRCANYIGKPEPGHRAVGDSAEFQPLPHE
jgi:hypothetical protein